MNYIGYCQKTKHRNRALLLIKPLGVAWTSVSAYFEHMFQTLVRVVVFFQKKQQIMCRYLWLFICNMSSHLGMMIIIIC